MTLRLIVVLAVTIAFAASVMFIVLVMFPDPDPTTTTTVTTPVSAVRIPTSTPACYPFADCAPAPIRGGDLPGPGYNG